MLLGGANEDEDERGWRAMMDLDKALAFLISCQVRPSRAKHVYSCPLWALFNFVMAC